MQVGIKKIIMKKNILKKYKTLWLLVLVVSISFFHGCNVVGNYTVIKLAHGLDPTHPVHLSMVYLAELVEERSNGELRIDIYPSGQLGSERECIELLQIGSLGMTKVSASVMENFTPLFKVYNLPYIFRDDEHRFKVLEGEIGEKLLLETERFRIRGLGYLDAGSRSFYTKEKPILEPANLVGLKIRVQESTTAIKMIQALGGSATPIAWGELYTALQQGVVDGAENNPPTFHTSRHYEVCKYYSLDEHTSVPDVLIISTVIWNGLSKSQQQILLDAVKDAAEYQKKIWQIATNKALAEIEKAGVKIYRPDKSVFEKKVAPMIEEFKTTAPDIYELVQKIKAVQ